MWGSMVSIDRLNVPAMLGGKGASFHNNIVSNLAALCNPPLATLCHCSLPCCTCAIPCYS